MRSLFGLVVALSLSACKEEPRGQLEPIPRPPGMKDAPPPAPKGTAQADAPAVDPSKVTLRWKLVGNTPIAYRITLDREGPAPSSEPVEAPDAKGKKGKGKDKPEPKVERAPAPTDALPGSLTYVVERSNSGGYQLRVIPEGNSAAEDSGSMSERGFVLDGLQGVTRNTASLVMELPLAAVGLNDTWALGTELLKHDALGPAFAADKTERRNRVKLTALTPVDGGDQVATLEYDLVELLNGKVTQRRPPPAVPAHTGDPDTDPAATDESAPPTVPASAEVRITGKGEFLVKAGHWRSWEGSITATTRGAFPANALQVPPGKVKLKLTALESAPASQPTAKPQQ
ncbi:hypothetical protein [Myxococcus stipitatus]|uniref:hypothetical protein n=1 Tax=Myxococcus stipitatus TaxID=83455 RepID=UPI0030D3D45C